MYELAALNELHCDMETAAFISVLTELSSHKEIKILPMLVRCFDYKNGVKIKILEPKSLSGETYIIVSDYLSDGLTENCLVRKFVGLCADNTNSVFGVAEV